MIYCGKQKDVKAASGVRDLRRNMPGLPSYSDAEN
jgi:hypothetical protein